MDLFCELFNPLLALPPLHTLISLFLNAFALLHSLILSSPDFQKAGKEASETGHKGSERWGSYEYVGRAGSVIPTTSLAGTEVSVDEIRSAASVSVPLYPSLDDPSISSPQSQFQPQFYGKFPTYSSIHTTAYSMV